MEEHPFRHIVQKWLAVIGEAKRRKHAVFGTYADECWQFFNGPAKHMWETLKGEGLNDLPKFCITINRIFEAVALFSPTLIHRYPQVTVNPVQLPLVMPNDPEVIRRQRCSTLKQHYGNWVQREARKKEQSRLALTDAIVSGLGLLETQIYTPPGSQIKYPRSTFLPSDDVLYDPDASMMEGLQWVAIRRREAMPVVEANFGLQPGAIKGHYQSAFSQVDERAKAEAKLHYEAGVSFDICEYWEVFSKQGFGDRLKYTGNRKTDIDTSVFGQFTRIVVCEGVPYPLNMPTPLMDGESAETLFMKSQWPVPFWMDGGWPFKDLGFYRDTRSPYPIALSKNGIGYLKFMNWCMSFLADRVAASGTTYVAYLKAVAQNVGDSLMGGGGPFKKIELDELCGTGDINKLVTFLQAPNVQFDVWKMADQCMALYDKSTGLTELLYGSTSSALRSATEADIKQQNLQIRPDDMAATVDDWASGVASNEIQAACWSCGFEDFRFVLGDQGAQELLENIAAAGPDSVVREYSYSVVAGSSRKPDKNGRQTALTQLGQVIQPLLQQFAAQGITGPYNAFVSDLAESFDVDPSRYLLPDFTPMSQQIAAENADVNREKIDAEREALALEQSSAEGVDD